MRTGCVKASTLYSPLAQSVEHTAVNRAVARSSRVGGAIAISHWKLYHLIVNPLWAT